MSRGRLRKWIFRVLDSLRARYRRHRWRFNLRKHLVDLSQVPIKSPIFVLGTQGGGLSLISRVLRRHPTAVSVTGDNSYWVGSDEMQNVLSDALPDALRLQGHSALEERDLQESWLYASDRLLPRFRLTGEDATDALADLLLDRLRELLLLFGGGRADRRFVDKSQSYTVKVSFLARLLEDHDPKFVLVTRNPYAMCQRAVERVLTSVESVAERRRLAAEHWCNSMQCALRDGQGRDGFETVRFEDFLLEPRATLGLIDDIVEMGLKPSLLPSRGDRLPLGRADQGEKWFPLRPNVNAKYLDFLDDDVVRVVDERCGQLATRFGYSPEGP